MRKFIFDAITYEGNTWLHSLISVCFELSIIITLGAIMFALSR